METKTMSYVTIVTPIDTKYVLYQLKKKPRDNDSYAYTKKALSSLIIYNKDVKLLLYKKDV